MESQIGPFVNSVSRLGWAVTEPVISSSDVAVLRTELGGVAQDGRGGARNLLDHASIRALATSSAIHTFASGVLGDGCFAVRALLFDKTPTANWKVMWHQDLTIPVREVAAVAGYGPWTEKAGVPHVQPPVSVLERMLAVRVHLDASDSDNGPVRVLSGTHTLGRLSGPQIDELRSRTAEAECLVGEGGLLAFRPLLLHASSPALSPRHRRVIHFEFAVDELAAPLEWRWRVA